MIVVEEVGFWAGMVTSCDRPLKKRHARHFPEQYKVVRGHGSGQQLVICRACATPAQMRAIRAARRR